MNHLAIGALGAAVFLTIVLVVSILALLMRAVFGELAPTVVAGVVAVGVGIAVIDLLTERRK